MKILIVSPFLPNSLDSGGKTRLYNLLRKVVDSGVEVVFFVIGEKEFTRNDINKFKAIFPEVKLYCKFFKPSFFAKIKYFLSNFIHADKNCFAVIKNEINSIINKEKINILQIEFSQFARYLSKTKINSILVIHEIRFKKIWREVLIQKKLVMKFFFLVKYFLLKKEELFNFSKFDQLVVMSNEDSKNLSGYNLSSISVIENGVDVDVFNFSFSGAEKKIYFLGWFGNVQNEDSLEYYLKSISPNMKNNDGFELSIFGGDLRESIKKRVEDVGGRYYGFLENEHLLKEVMGSILVVPLRYGGGTRLKILEAMAIGNPVVSTTIGAEGLDVQNNYNILIADSPGEFCLAINRLMQNNELRKKIVLNARKLVEDKYDWRVITEKQVLIYKNILSK